MRDKLIALVRHIPGLESQIRGRSQGKTYITAAHVADYLLANGVIVPPCKVGQTVFVVSRYYTGTWEVFEGKIEEITLYEKHIFMRIKAKGNFAFADEVSQIGKCVFFSLEEAEKALAERSAE